MEQNLFKPRGGRDVIRVDPTVTGWRHLDFRVLSLAAGDRFEIDSAGRETAVVPLTGAGIAQAGASAFRLERPGSFETAASLLYIPPATDAALTAEVDWAVAIGSAPASGRYPVRMIEPAEVKVEIRGSGPALRQVNHLLAHPLPAERLIVYEVFVPGGAWAGWPPHCHDGRHGSPYLEETYFFRFADRGGFGFHRNYLSDDSFDECFTIHDQDCVAVPRGFHVTTTAPGHTMWILNFLAGDLVGEQRATPPYFDPAAVDWSRGQIELPVASKSIQLPGGRQ